MHPPLRSRRPACPFLTRAVPFATRVRRLVLALIAHRARPVAGGCGWSRHPRLDVRVRRRELRREGDGCPEVVVFPRPCARLRPGGRRPPGGTWDGYMGSTPSRPGKTGRAACTCCTKRVNACRTCNHSSRYGQVAEKWNQIRRTLVLTNAATFHRRSRSVLTWARATSGRSAVASRCSTTNA